MDPLFLLPAVTFLLVIGYVAEYACGEAKPKAQQSQRYGFGKKSTVQGHVTYEMVFFGSAPAYFGNSLKK